ncbi:MAG: hypothetical protein KAI66_02435 [Lentisphaeria bacterium]|nr:hypothetical protein [Lentisphaeria bacterium]
MARTTLALALAMASAAGADGENLLLNPRFDFHSFVNHRKGKAESWRSGYAASWNTSEHGAVEAVREARVDAKIRPSFSTGNLLRIRPGRKVWQFATLPELGLAHGEVVSLHVFGHQAGSGQLRARIVALKLDSEDGSWTPADLGMSDKRSFPRHSRGELVSARMLEASATEVGGIELAVADFAIPGSFHASSRDTSYSADANVIALRIEFENMSTDEDAWVWWPSLVRDAACRKAAAPTRVLPTAYRHIPRTMQKLWKGEPIHILLMGSSIDRGSANPPMYLYDEDPASETFKQPLSDRMFEGDKVGRPDLDGYVGWWQHYWSYAGRLRLELMRKFDLPVSKICLNFMACDGSCVGEAHSGLAEYCSLSLPPEENGNGHKSGGDWRTLYPELFTRPGGPGPDLVIFGSGANEKTDTPDEGAVFEGMMRWIQRHYPDAEFLSCMFQNVGGYTPNPGDLQALGLRYGVPMMDYGKVGDDVTRWCNRYALVPRDGHPQAASHYLWFKQLERAFECVDPTLAGAPQQLLPSRMHPNSYGWEGEMVQFGADSARIRTNLFVFEDMAVNCWGGTAADSKPVPYVDGVKLRARRSSPRRDLRNSLSRHGRTTLGDRHILEITGKDAKLTAVDAKACPNRRFLGVESLAWRKADLPVADFASVVGAPYGEKMVVLPPGASMEIDVVATDVSIAFADRPDGGTLRVLVDGVERLMISTDKPFKTQAGEELFLENRRGVLGLGYGVHTVRVEAVDKVVSVLGLFTYDSRSNSNSERRLRGFAQPGETVRFAAPFHARPVVFCSGGLTVRTADVTADSVTFSGTSGGAFEAVGE